ncbi:hypothetical protein [Streptomyces sp. NPDC054794]
MRKSLTPTALPIMALVVLTACSSNSPSNQPSDAKAATPASRPLTAAAALTGITAAVPSAKKSGVVTADNDPNHLLGRPNQYTSKVTFEDTRIPGDQVSGTEKGDVERGGAIEVFGSPADAKARATYIQAITKSMPALAEYDYVHGTILVRVSHYLTPKQATGYKSTADMLG